VAQLSLYRGTVWATWDPAAPWFSTRLASVEWQTWQKLTWAADLGLGLPLILLTVVIHVFGLALINDGVINDGVIQVLRRTAARRSRGRFPFSEFLQIISSVAGTVLQWVLLC
jgi:hypothetical protein